MVLPLLALLIVNPYTEAAMITSVRIQHYLPIIVIALSTLFSIGYSSGPIFEAPDEIQHYVYIRKLANGEGLQDDYYRPDLWLSGAWFEPPLYYAMAALIKLPISDTDFGEISERKNVLHPNLIRVSTHDPPPPIGNDNKNFFLHSRREDFPYLASGTALAIHMIRLYSVALGTLTLIVAFAIFRLLWPDRLGWQLSALGIVAFWPLREFMAGVINNDNLISLTATVSLYLILRQARLGPSWKDAALLGAALGLSLIAKKSGLLLVAPYGLAVLLDWKRQWRYVPLTLGMAAILGGWWYLRHWIMYGEISTYTMITVHNGRIEIWSRPGFSLLDVLDKLTLTYQRFWASFNHDGTVPVGPELNSLYNILTVLGLAGALIGFVRWVRTNRQRGADRSTVNQIVIMAGYVVTTIVAMTYVAMTVILATQPRYSLPSASMLGALLAFGWDSLTPKRLKLRVALSSVMLWAAMACYALAGYFLPVYQPLPAPDQVEHPLNLNFESKLTLIGTAQETVSAWPGDTVSITLYWQAGQPTPHMNYVLLLRTTNANWWTKLSYPAKGHLLANEWTPGQRWAEHYQFKLPSDAIPGTYGIAVSFEQLDPLHLLAARLPDGTLDTAPVVIQLVIL